MDLLAKRYASPFVLIDEMIQAGRFYDFVVEVNSIIYEEKQEEIYWDIWLHKIFNQTWDEWREYIRNRSEAQNVTELDLEATITASYELLNGFNPNVTE